MTAVRADGSGRWLRATARHRHRAVVGALACVLLAGAAMAKDAPTHLLTFLGTKTGTAAAGPTAHRPACLLQVSLRRLSATAIDRTADLTLEFADPREGHHGPLFASVRLDLDDVRGMRGTMRLDGAGCDDLRPLNLHLACTTADGRCPSGTRVRLKNFDRLEIAEKTLAFD